MTGTASSVPSVRMISSASSIFTALRLSGRFSVSTTWVSCRSTKTSSLIFCCLRYVIGLACRGLGRLSRPRSGRAGWNLEIRHRLSAASFLDDHADRGSAFDDGNIEIGREHV